MEGGRSASFWCISRAEHTQCLCHINSKALLCEPLPSSTEQHPNVDDLHVNVMIKQLHIPFFALHPYSVSSHVRVRHINTTQMAIINFYPLRAADIFIFLIFEPPLQSVLRFYST